MKKMDYLFKIVIMFFTILIITNHSSIAKNVQATTKKKVIVTYDKKNDTVIFSGKGVIKEFDFNLDKIAKKDKIKKVIIKKGIEKIGKFAFGGCDIKTVEIEECVKSIGDYAFTGEWSLKSIKIPKSVKKIGKAILDTDARVKITMPGNFKYKKPKTYYGYNVEDTYYIFKCKKANVIFNTPINLETIKHIGCANFTVSKKDKKLPQ